MRSSVRLVIRLPVFLSMTAITLIAVNIWLYLKLIDAGNYARYCENIRVSTLKDDRYVNRAVHMWAQFSREPVESIVRSTYPNRIELDETVCVSLLPIGLGGEPVYCFSKKTDKPTLIRQDVE